MGSVHVADTMNEFEQLAPVDAASSCEGLSAQPACFRYNDKHVPFCFIEAGLVLVYARDSRQHIGRRNIPGDFPQRTHTGTTA